MSSLREVILGVLVYKSLFIMFEYLCLRRKEVLEIFVIKVVEWFFVNNMFLILGVYNSDSEEGIIDVDGEIVGEKDCYLIFYIIVVVFLFFIFCFINFFWY